MKRISLSVVLIAEYR